MKIVSSILLVAFALSVTGALAQEQGHLNVRTTVQKEEIIVNESGEEERRLVDADIVVPGDSVVYTITFSNISDETAENVTITNPIAESLTYVEGSAFGPGMVIEFSVDGGKSFDQAADLMVANNGDQRPADAGDFTHVRWTLENDLEPGAQAMAHFRAQLN